jgi:hypothetical protein
MKFPIEKRLIRISPVTKYSTMNRSFVKFAAPGLLVAAIAGCASQRPLLSPNAHLNQVGTSMAERDVEDCMARGEVAKSEGKLQNSGENVVANAAGSSVVGAAAGGAGGAIAGNAAQGAAAGAVGGAVASLTASMLRWLFTPKPPDTSYMLFVDRCLREKGYDPAGWK